MAQQQHRLTISVPEAGRRLGIGRNHAYECARRGELPVIRLGNKLVVPLAAFEAMLTDPGRRLLQEPTNPGAAVR